MRGTSNCDSARHRFMSSNNATRDRESAQYRSVLSYPEGRERDRSRRGSMPSNNARHGCDSRRRHRSMSSNKAKRERDSSRYGSKSSANKGRIVGPPAFDNTLCRIHEMRVPRLPPELQDQNSRAMREMRLAASDIDGLLMSDTGAW